MSIAYEDVILQVHDVYLYEDKCALYLLNDRICFYCYDTEEYKRASEFYSDIRKLNIPTEDKSKIELELVHYSERPYTFHFVNESGIEGQIRDRDLVKKHMARLLLKFNKEQEERMRIFAESPAYWKLYKRRVLVEGMSEEEFWVQHPVVDLIALNDESRAERNVVRQREIENPRIMPSFGSISPEVNCKRIFYSETRQYQPIGYLKKATTSTTELLPFSAVGPTLCGLPTEYILYPSIFIHLDIRDILNLSQTNRYMQHVCGRYLSKMKILDFSQRWAEPISDNQFTILIENCKRFRELNFNKCYWLADYQLKPLLLNNIKNLGKLIVKISELGTGKLLKNCRKLKSLLIYGYGINFNHMYEIFEILCQNNLTLDNIFLTDGFSKSSNIFSYNCKD